MPEASPYVTYNYLVALVADAKIPRPMRTYDNAPPVVAQPALEIWGDTLYPSLTYLYAKGWRRSLGKMGLADNAYIKESDLTAYIARINAAGGTSGPYYPW